MGPGQKAYPVKKKHIAEGPALTGRPFCRFGQDIDGSRRRDWAAKKPDMFGLFAGDICFVPTLWRGRRDSNPRMLSHRRFSRPVLSTTQPSLRARKSMTDSNAGLILPHSVPPVNEFLNCRACFFALCRENGEKREGKDCTNRRHCAILYISRGVSTDCLYAARGQWAHAFMYNRDTPEVHSLPVLPS